MHASLRITVAIGSEEIESHKAGNLSRGSAQSILDNVWELLRTTRAIYDYEEVNAINSETELKYTAEVINNG